VTQESGSTSGRTLGVRRRRVNGGTVTSDHGCKRFAPESYDGVSARRLAGSDLLLPVAFGIDAEPDERALGLDSAKASGLERVFDVVATLRDHLSECTGQPVHLTWVLRMDPMVERACVSVDWVAARWDELRASR
jgi:hypothetical protein